MSHSPPHNTGAPPTPSVVILGNDAVLAARPATAVQLAHACQALGYDAAVPASWGDELVAGEAVRQLRERSNGNADGKGGARGRGARILCACPHVEARLLAPGPDLASLLVGVVSPPVAAARYLRRLYGERPVHVTYVGACPSARADAASAERAIDVAIAPLDFLRTIAEHGVRLADQPTVYDSVIPPDRRRFCSLPGGAPSPSCLWDEEHGAHTLVEIAGEDYRAELAQHLLSKQRALVDLAPRLGCACSGASAATAHPSARAVVATTEPPRATGPVVEPLPGLELQRDVAAARAMPRVATSATPPSSMPAVGSPPTPASGAPKGATTAHPSAPSASAPPHAPSAPSADAATGGTGAPPARKKATQHSGIFRAYTGQVPTTRSPEGKPVPRAYAAHRKATPGGGVVAQRPAAADVPVPIVDEPDADAATVTPDPTTTTVASQRAAASDVAAPVDEARVDEARVDDVAPAAMPNDCATEASEAVGGDAFDAGDEPSDGVPALDATVPPTPTPALAVAPAVAPPSDAAAPDAPPPDVERATEAAAAAEAPPALEASAASPARPSSVDAAEPHDSRGTSAGAAPRGAAESTARRGAPPLPPRRSAFAFLTADDAAETSADDAADDTPADATGDDATRHGPRRPASPPPPAASAPAGGGEQSPVVLPVLSAASRRVPSAPFRAPIDVRHSFPDPVLEAARQHRRRTHRVAVIGGTMLVLAVVATAITVRGGYGLSGALGGAPPAAGSVPPGGAADAAASAVTASPNATTPVADSSAAVDSAAADRIADSVVSSLARDSAAAAAAAVAAASPTADSAAPSSSKSDGDGASTRVKRADSTTRASVKKDSGGLTGLLRGTIFQSRGARRGQRAAAAAVSSSGDSAAASTAATGAERDVIRREIEQRRARIDSIWERLDSLRTVKPAKAAKPARATDPDKQR